MGCRFYEGKDSGMRLRLASTAQRVVQVGLQRFITAMRVERGSARRGSHVIALHLVRQVERQLGPLPARHVPRLFHVRGRALAAGDVPLPLAPLVPAGHETVGRLRVRAAVAADLVVLAKLPVRGGIKVRAGQAPGSGVALWSFGVGQWVSAGR